MPILLKRAPWSHRSNLVLVAAFAGSMCLFVPALNHAFQTPKIVGLWLVLGFPLLTSRGSGSRRLHPLIAVIMLWPLARAIFIEDPVHALEPLLVWLPLCGLVLGQLTLDAADRRNLRAALTLSGVAVSVYGLIQVMGWDCLNWNIKGQPLSLMGNPGFTAHFLVLVLTAGRFPRGKWKISLVLLMVATVVFTGSRAAFLALLVVFFLRFRKHRWRILTLMLLLAAVLGFHYRHHIIQGMDFVRHPQTHVTRYRQQPPLFADRDPWFQGKGRSLLSRWWLALNAGTMIPRAFWLGLGPGQFRREYPAHARAVVDDVNFSHEYRARSPHNAMLDGAISLGTPWLLLVLIALSRTLFRFRRTALASMALAQWMLALFTISYLQPLLMTLAFLLVPPSLSENPPRNKARAWAAWCATAGLLIALTWVDWQVEAASRANCCQQIPQWLPSERARVLASEGQISQALSCVIHALEIDPYAPEFIENARILCEMLDPLRDSWAPGWATDAHALLKTSFPFCQWPPASSNKNDSHSKTPPAPSPAETRHACQALLQRLMDHHSRRCSCDSATGALSPTRGYLHSDGSGSVPCSKRADCGRLLLRKQRCGSTHSSGRERRWKMIALNGRDLTLEQLNAIADGSQVTLDEESAKAVATGRQVVDDIMARHEVVYGVNTGFGNFATVVIPPDKIETLQYNLVRSHAAGVGPCLDAPTCRMIMALRANTLAKGHSGVRLENLQALIHAINAGFHPYIPEQGSVGASGDLAPLAHLALNLIGEGQAFFQGDLRPAKAVLRHHGLKPITLKAKEGLAFINGTQVMAAIGAGAMIQVANLLPHADLIGALSLEALLGTRRAFDVRIHEARPHAGQGISADNLWRLLADSEIMDSHRNCGRVQDSYSLRCMPQVHGPTRDTFYYALNVLETEINSATDNPMVFSEQNELVSGGNFHGQSLALVFDFLSIAVAELANMSERRIERLCNPSLSDLPAFLVADGGLNSGFMIAHCTAASLVSENKCLCHPASVDSISTSAAKEDHVSMGTIAARKLRQVVENTSRVLAIELLAACQGLEFRKLRPARALIPVKDEVRQHIPAWELDRYMAPDLESAYQLLLSGILKSRAETLCGDLK